MFGTNIVALHKKHIKNRYYFFSEKFIWKCHKKRGWNRYRIAPQVSKKKKNVPEINPAALPDSTRKTFKNNRRWHRPPIASQQIKTNQAQKQFISHKNVVHFYMPSRFSNNKPKHFKFIAGEQASAEYLSLLISFFSSLRQYCMFFFLALLIYLHIIITPHSAHQHRTEKKIGRNSYTFSVFFFFCFIRLALLPATK